MSSTIWQLIDSSSVGGAERHIETIASSLRNSGLPVKVVLYDRHGENPWLQQLSHSGLDFEILDGRSATLWTSIRRAQPGLIHTHGYKAGILGRIAARAHFVPVVSTYHSGERGPFPVGLYDFVDDWTGCLGRRIGVSQAIQSRLPFSSTYIPSYVNTAISPPAEVLPRNVAFIGRLSAEKGPDMFCELAARAPAGAIWNVYGDGPMRSKLEAQYGNFVRFHGVQTDMGRIWPDIGLVVMPSRFEGIPLVALEAGARGVPVLASNVGGLPNVVNDGVSGWLFERENIAAALEGLHQWSDLLGSAHEMSMRAACWLHVREHFSERRWFPEILTVYRSAGWS